MCHDKLKTALEVMTVSNHFTYVVYFKFKKFDTKIFGGLIFLGKNFGRIFEISVQIWVKFEKF